MRSALERGRLTHRLLQALPDISPSQRSDAARAYLARAGRGFPETEREATITAVLRVLDNAAFAALFAPGTRAELPIVGRLARADAKPVAVSGQIDRLAITADAVLIADYKTDRAPPARVEDVPPEYVTQLALYRAVLARLYPGRRVRAALVWTETPALMELSAQRLDDALVHLGVSRLDALAHAS